jgi:hypothetical protein
MSAETPTAVTAFGPVMQLGFVVPDIPASVHYWTSIGVGPFFLMEHISFAECRYRGQPTEIDMSVAVAQWGAVQVELIQQHDATPSIYNTTDCSSRGGLQHFGVMTTSVADDLRHLESRGVHAVQSGSTGNGIRFAYVDTDTRPGAYPGCMIELIESGAAIDGFFEIVRKAAINWDGSKPLRKIG